jgi:ABC-type spermidine/putrescine transport system permease subunit II
MAMRGSKAKVVWAGIIGWTAAIVMFFPIFWMLLAGFKTEIDAVGPPELFFKPTMQNFVDVNARADYFAYALNSVVESLGATIISLALAVPAAYAAAFFRTKRTKDLLLWMLSTKMMPAVGVLLPMYLLFRDGGLLDTRIGLIILFTLSNLPIAWTARASAPKSGISSCRSRFRASPRQPCSPSSCAGTRLSGASTSPPPGPDRSRPSSPRFPAPRACSGPSSRRLPPWR